MVNGECDVKRGLPENNAFLAIIQKYQQRLSSLLPVAFRPLKTPFNHRQNAPDSTNGATHVPP